MERIFYGLGGLVILTGLALSVLAPTDLMTSRDAFFARLGIIGPALIYGFLIVGVGYIIHLLKAIRDHLVPVQERLVSDDPVEQVGSMAIGAVGAVGVAAAGLAHAASAALQGKSEYPESADEIAPAQEQSLQEHGLQEQGLSVTQIAPAHEATQKEDITDLPDLTSYLDSLLNPTAQTDAAHAVTNTAEVTSQIDQISFDLSDLGQIEDAPPLSLTQSVSLPVDAPTPSTDFDDSFLSQAISDALEPLKSEAHPDEQPIIADVAAPSMALANVDEERAPTVAEYLAHPEHHDTQEPNEIPRAVMREGQFAGRRYRMFEDGSLEIDTEQSTIKFDSLDEFRSFVSSANKKS